MSAEIDHEYTDEIVCPYCGHETSDSWEMSDSGEDYCDVCEKEFSYERCVTVKYGTSKNEARND